MTRVHGQASYYFAVDFWPGRIEQRDYAEGHLKLFHRVVNVVCVLYITRSTSSIPPTRGARIVGNTNQIVQVVAQLASIDITL